MDALPNNDNRECIAIDCLQIGMRLRNPIYDEHDVLLLADGTVITASFLQKLRSRGVHFIRVAEADLERINAMRPHGTAKEARADREGFHSPITTPVTDRLDSIIAGGTLLELASQGAPFCQQLARHGTAPYSQKLRERFIAEHSESVSAVDTVLGEMFEGHGLDQLTLTDVAEDSLRNLSSDPDLFVCLGINPFADTYPARHSLHVSMLAVALGARMDLDRETLLDLALGCMIHDAGMLKIDPESYGSQNNIDGGQFAEIAKHPILTLEMIEDVERLPLSSVLVAYQLHERCDGSGYPRKRSGGQIHALARIGAVADAFVALVSPRPHRPGMLPYRALEKMIRGVEAGLYDGAVVRALLETVSLFPIGSYVLLSDGSHAQVLRANSESYNLPMVSVWDADGEQQIIDLATELSLKIVKPLAALSDRSGGVPTSASSTVRARSSNEVDDAGDEPLGVQCDDFFLPPDARTIADSWY